MRDDTCDNLFHQHQRDDGRSLEYEMREYADLRVREREGICDRD